MLARMENKHLSYSFLWLGNRKCKISQALCQHWPPIWNLFDGIMKAYGYGTRETVGNNNAEKKKGYIDCGLRDCGVNGAKGEGFFVHSLSFCALLLPTGPR